MQKRQVLPTIPKQYEQLGWEGGFNSNDDSTKILQNQITGESKNVTIENKLLKKVTGYTQEGVIFPAGGTAINGLDKYYSESGSRYLMTVSGVQTYYDIGAGHVVTGGVLSGEYRITSVTMNNLWILCNGNDVARKFEHGVGTVT